MSENKFRWLLKKLSWPLLALTAVFAFTSVKFLGHLLTASSALESLFSDSAAQLDRSSTSDWLVWIFRVSCTVVLATILGALWTIGSHLYRTAAKHRFILDAGIVRTSCTVLPVSRLAMNIIHALSIMSTIWFGAVLCYMCTLVFAFEAVDKRASNAMNLQLTEQVDQVFFTDTRAWLQDTDGQLQGIVQNVKEYCSRLQCGTTIIDSVKTLQILQTDVKELEMSMSAISTVTCPTVACVNVEQFNFWGTSASGCVCTPDAVEAMQADASQGHEGCRLAIIWLAAAFVALVLLQSSSAMRLKSLVKDHHWMHRFRTLADDLAMKGIAPPNSTYSLLNEGSLSHFPIHQPPTLSMDPAQGMPEYKAAGNSKGRAVRTYGCVPQKPTGMLAHQGLDDEGSGEGMLKAVGGADGSWRNTRDGPDLHDCDVQQHQAAVPVPPPRV